MANDIIARGLAVKNKNDIQTNSTQIANLTKQFAFGDYVLDISEAYADNALTALTIPTYDTSGEATHPSILYFKDGWNSYYYWMLFTPYPDSDAAYENPSILASNDGETWVVPAGLTNPIVAKPAGVSEYNSDPHLFMYNNVMYVIWRERVSTLNNIKAVYSSDGINWSEQITLISHDNDLISMLSPCLLYDNGVFKIAGIDIVSNPNDFVVYESSTLTGTYTETVRESITCPAGREIWHMEILKFNQRYYMLAQLCDTDSAGVNGTLHLAESLDLETWTLNEDALMEQVDNMFDATFYKSTMYPIFKNGQFALELWYAVKYTDWQIAHTTIKFDKTDRDNMILNNRTRKLMQGIHKVGKGVAGDVFKRDNSTESLGDSTSGDTWTVLGGVFGITGGYAYQPTDANSKVVLDAGVANFETGLTVKTLSSQEWLMFRVSDTNNYFRIGQTGGRTKFQKIVAGVLERITDTIDVANGVHYSVICNGDNIKIYIDGKLRIDTDDSFNNTATKAGMQTDDSLTRFGDFYINIL